MLGAIRPAVAQLFSSMSIRDDLHIVLARPPIGTSVLYEVFFFALARGAPLLDATIANLAIAWICGQAGPCSYGQHVLPNTICYGNGLPAKSGYRHLLQQPLRCVSLSLSNLSKARQVCGVGHHEIEVR